MPFNFGCRGPVRDMTGQRYGRLTVIEFAGIHRTGEARWRCKCDCGGERVITRWRLKNKTRSCGCLQREAVARMMATEKRGRTHGRSYDALYRTWQAMINRCECPTSGPYKHYGARGIGVCERWRNSFEAFASDVGERPSQAHSLDRVDVNGHYEPGNVRWATASEQSNNRRTSRFLEIGGLRKTVAGWSQMHGIAETTIHERLRRGWSPEQAVAMPVDGDA